MLFNAGFPSQNSFSSAKTYKTVQRIAKLALVGVIGSAHDYWREVHHLTTELKRPPVVKLEEHPIVKRVRARSSDAAPAGELGPLDGDWLRKLCLDAGADDVGFVEVDRPELATDRPGVLAAFPHAKSLISFVCRMNREPIRTPARSVANLEFHRTGDHVNEVARAIIAVLEARGVRAMNPSMGFPMEMDRFPGKVWVVSHKLAAVAAGLGQMGIHRNVIHPKFGSFILLGTILIDAPVSVYSKPLD